MSHTVRGCSSSGNGVGNTIIYSVKGIVFEGILIRFYTDNFAGDWFHDNQVKYKHNSHFV